MDNLCRVSVDELAHDRSQREVSQRDIDAMRQVGALAEMMGPEFKDLIIEGITERITNQDFRAIQGAFLRGDELSIGRVIYKLINEYAAIVAEGKA